MKKPAAELIIKISVICKRKEVEALLKSRGIVPNNANVCRFINMSQQCALNVGPDFYEGFPTERETLLMSGFTFSKGAAK